MEKYTVTNGRNKSIIISPKNCKATHSLIWLGGLNETAETHVPLFFSERSVAPDYVKVIIIGPPIKPVQLFKGKLIPAWYDLFNTDYDETHFDHNHVREGIEFIRQFVDEEVKEHGGDYKKVLIGGFSGGAAMALQTGFTYGDKLAGIACLSATVLPVIKVPQRVCPVLLVHGNADMMLPYMKTMNTLMKSRLLTKPGTKHFTVEGMPHAIYPESQEHLRQFLHEQLK